MSDIIKFTKDNLTHFMTLIRSKINDVASTIDEKDKYIIAAALQGKKIITYSSTVTTSDKKVGNIFYNTSTKKYMYYNGSSLVALTVDLLLTAANSNQKFPTREWWEVASTVWQTATPFVDTEGMVSAIYKGEIAGDYTKWLLIMKQDSEDQTFTATKSSDSSYVYSKQTIPSSGYSHPWEIWLPTSLAAKSVNIDWT